MWQEIDNKLYQKFSFKDFVEAFGFMTKVAIISEKINHHATITNTYNTVELWLTTHDKGNTITEKDRSLAEKIDGIIGA
jgi:4a-hydroxytetrahydrobiopterin dehydratase